MNIRKSIIFAGDFETTVYDNQDITQVWASACVKLYDDDVKLFHSIGEQFEYFLSLNQNIICYYHNLKFDGSFWLSYLMIDLGLEQSVKYLEDGGIQFNRPKDMKNNSFTYSISSLGQWYRITIKMNGHIIEFRDSLKLLPFSIKRIGNSFGTKHQKLEMDYEGYRYPGCEISEKEANYIANDVLVLKEALEIMYTEGHKRLTIGSCCLAEYKKSIGGKTYDRYFPNQYDIALDYSYGSLTAGDYVKASYHGGWCYVAEGKEGKVFKDGLTIDVNSLYPSMMSSESGNSYPVGMPIFWKGNYIPDEATDGEHYFFLRFKTRFYLKEGKLPFIQIKNTLGYRSNEMLKTSDRFNSVDGVYYDKYIDLDNEVKPSTVTLTMTMIDYKLFLEHYNVADFEILDGCYYKSAVGIFDEYIEKYKRIKVTSKGAKRELAKLFLNNLYGKMASSTVSNFKIAYVKPDKTIGFYTQLANDKEPGYIPVGSAITSYSRNFTIRAAQANYYGQGERGFIYADTDSIHCDLSVDELKNIKIHSTDFCHWKVENKWDMGYFMRQKTYIEHITEDDSGAGCDEYNIKCAGMPEKCKKLFMLSVRGVESDLSEDDKKFIASLSDDELDFVLVRRDISDFKIGLCVPGKLLPKRIPGGVLLVPTTYEMR